MTRDEEVLKQFKLMRNRIKSVIRNIDREEQLDIAKKCKSNPKKIWKFVNSRTKYENSIPELIWTKCENEVKVASQDTDKACLLNDYFATVFNSSNIGNEVRCESVNIHTPICELTINEEDVVKYLAKLNPNKSAGIDNIHPRVLKEVSKSISAALLIIFNQTLKEGYLPKDWRSSNISAIFKKGKRNSVKNYRPISLTCVACKILESILRDKIINYFNENKLFSTNQYGFIKGRSTVSQLLKILDEWTQQLEKGGQIDVVYTDLEKAFDRLPHKLLIQKLQKYKISSTIINWICSFLLNRRQRVSVNGRVSHWTDVTSGVPQGSVLGPLLFIIYINDLNSNNPNISTYLYADDAKFYMYIKTFFDSIQLQNEMDSKTEWFDEHLLSLNVAKCYTVSYGRKIEHKNTYQIKGTVLEKKEIVKDLGIIYDDKLTFREHINDKVNKANSILGVIKRNFRGLTHEAFILLYKSMVRSHLEYGVQIWNPHHKEQIKKLENVQRRATKLIPKLKKLTYKDRLIKLGLPTLRFRRVRGDLIEIFKIITGIYDKSTSVELRFSTSTTTRGNRFKLATQCVKYDLRKYFFINRVTPIWNSLPDEVVTAPSVNSFKKRLDKFMSSQDMLYDWSCDITGTGSRSNL